MLDDEAFGAASEVKPKFTAHADPASQWTAARKGPAFFAYWDNYLIDTDHGIIVDVEASRSVKTAEVGASRRMIERTSERFGLKPDWVAADTAYGSAENLAWLALERQISATGVPSSPCLMMNAICASVNLDAFIAIRSSPSQRKSNGKL